MGPKEGRTEIISAHDEYRRLVREYQDAKEAYDLWPSDDNWNRLQEALRKLKRQGDIIELKQVRDRLNFDK